MQLNQTPLETNIKKIEDFGAKNIGLIAIFAVALGALVYFQAPARQKAASNGLSFNSQSTNSYALGNSNSGSGQVLGASQYNPELIKQFSSINILTSADTSKTALQTYADQLAIIKSADNAEALAAGSGTTAQQDKLIADLKALAAPEVFADYHRLTLAYYSLKFMARQPDNQIQNADALADVVAGQAQQIAAGFQTSAGVALK